MKGMETFTNQTKDETEARDRKTTECFKTAAIPVRLTVTHTPPLSPNLSTSNDGYRSNTVKLRRSFTKLSDVNFRTSSNLGPHLPLSLTRNITSKPPRYANNESGTMQFSRIRSCDNSPVVKQKNANGLLPTHSK